MNTKPGEASIQETSCKRFEIGEKGEEMSRAKEQDSFLHGASAWFKPC